MAEGLTRLMAEDFNRDTLRKPGWWLVDVSTAWCPPCRHLTPKLKELAAVYRGRIEFAHVDPEEDAPGVSVDLKVQSVPTMVLFRDGVAIARKVGDLPKSSLTAWLEGALAEG